MAFSRSYEYSLPKTQDLEQRRWKSVSGLSAPFTAPIVVPQDDWSNWEVSTTPGTDILTWHYGATSLSPADPGSSYHPNESSVSSLSPISESLSPKSTSPCEVYYPGDGQFDPMTQTTDCLVKPLAPPFHLTGSMRNDNLDEESDGGAWEPQRPRRNWGSLPLGSSHRRAKSTSEGLSRDAKRAHTIVERSKSNLFKFGACHRVTFALKAPITIAASRKNANTGFKIIEKD